MAGNDYGATLTETLELYENDPALKEAYAQIDQVAGVLGGLDAIVGWMGDTGIVVNQDGDDVEGGLVASRPMPPRPPAPHDAAQLRRSSGGASSGVTVPMRPTTARRSRSSTSAT